LCLARLIRFGFIVGLGILFFQYSNTLPHNWPLSYRATSIPDTTIVNGQITPTIFWWLNERQPLLCLLKRSEVKYVSAGRHFRPLGSCVKKRRRAPIPYSIIWLLYIADYTYITHKAPRVPVSSYLRRSRSKTTSEGVALPASIARAQRNRVTQISHPIHPPIRFNRCPWWIA
jgi:hypothetical protein